MMHKNTKADLKIVVVGNCNTGKTSFCHLWVKNEYSDKYKATIMTDFNYKIKEYKGEFYKVQIWDIAGQDRNIGTTKLLTKDAHGCIIFSDITNKRSLDETIKWKNAIDENSKFKDGSNLPCILIQNKIDLVDEIEVKDDASLKSFSSKNNFVKCFRTSVKQNINVNEAMDFLIGYIANKLFANEEKKTPKKESSKKQINIILHQNTEEVEKAMKKLGDSYCCSTFSSINQKRMNNLNTPVKNKKIDYDNY